MIKLRFGTRGSPLALFQTRYICERLCQANPNLICEEIIIKTLGDRVTNLPLFQVGGQGLFIKELEQALADNVIDVAVHSLKDVPHALAPGMVLAAVTEREDPRDVLLSASGLPLAKLPQGCTVGTSSLRRRAQLAKLRPDLRFVDLRGNLDTRLRKLGPENSDESAGNGGNNDDGNGIRGGGGLGSSSGSSDDSGSSGGSGGSSTSGSGISTSSSGGSSNSGSGISTSSNNVGQVQAIILAAAGLHRLGLQHSITQYLPINIMVPAAGQGLLGIECRADDLPRLQPLLASITDQHGTLAATAERAFLAALQGGCQTPLAAHATVKSRVIRLHAFVGSPDGRDSLSIQLSAPHAQAETLGYNAARNLMQRGAAKFLANPAANPVASTTINNVANTAANPETNNTTNTAANTATTQRNRS